MFHVVEQQTLPPDRINPLVSSGATIRTKFTEVSVCDESDSLMVALLSADDEDADEDDLWLLISR